MRRTWPLFVFVVACVVVAAVVAWWPRDDVIVRVESTDLDGICVRDMRTGAHECVSYNPEFPSEAQYEVGECLRFTDVYPSDGPPHARRVTCPAA